MATDEGATSTSQWPAIGASADNLEGAWLQAYSALQWLARVENSYLGPVLDPRKLQLSWAPDGCSIVTGEFEGNTSLEMRLPEFVLQFREDGSPTRYAFSPDDKSPAEIEAWILVELLHRKIDRSRFSKKLPYDVSHLLTGDALHFRTKGREREFENVADWLCAADEILRRTGEEASTRGLGAASPVKVRPSDFALFSQIRRQDGSTSPQGLEVGFGIRGDKKRPSFYARSGEGDPTKADAKPLDLPIDRLAEKGLDRDSVIAAFDLEARLGRSGS